MKKGNAGKRSRPFLISLIMNAVQQLPHAFALGFGTFLGFLTFYLWRSRSKIALRNLQGAWIGKKSDTEVRTIARKMYQNFGKGVMEFFRLPLLTSHNLHRYVTFEGLKHLEEARNQGRGAFLLSAHFGNWEMLSAAISLRGIPINLIVRKIKNPPIDDFVNEIRRRSGVNPIEKTQGTNEMLGALRKNETVGFVLDQHAHKSQGVCVNFFGQNVSAFKSLAMLARRYNIPIIPVFMIREPSGQHRAVFESALALCKGKNMSNSILDDTQQFINVIERFVRKYPEQWIWLHRWWRSPSPDLSRSC